MLCGSEKRSMARVYPEEDVTDNETEDKTENAENADERVEKEPGEKKARM
jgi:hypothetical protein